MLRGIRGATTVNNNNSGEIRTAVIELLNEIIDKNSINISDIACVDFTMTKDLDCSYPAKFAREISGFEEVPLMCYQELNIVNSLEKCIRVRFLVNTDKKQDEITHVYLNEAKSLRPDLAK